jgi:hypothetical protein
MQTMAATAPMMISKSLMAVSPLADAKNACAIKRWMWVATLIPIKKPAARRGDAGRHAFGICSWPPPVSRCLDTIRNQALTGPLVGFCEDAPMGRILPQCTEAASEERRPLFCA